LALLRCHNFDRLKISSLLNLLPSFIHLLNVHSAKHTGIAMTRDQTSELELAYLCEVPDNALAALPAQVTITLIPPTASPTYRERIGEMNGYLRSAAEAKGMRIIDLGPSLAPSGLLSPAYTTDGVHLSDSAYAVWRSEIEKAWTDLLRAYPEKFRRRRIPP
jgi:hypothetical protein